MMLDVMVEVAFDSGYSTPAVSRTWTDITEFVELNEGIDITVGRRDEFATAEPNTLSLTLDNTDGRFTPERPASPYYPNVKLFRPIRVTVTIPGSAPSVRFLGYVTQWPSQWPGGSDAYSSVSLSAVSRLSRMGSSSTLRSMLEQEILLDGPRLYYTLADPEGSVSASESSGNGGPVLTQVRGTKPGTIDAPVVFGQGVGPGSDGLSAAQFTHFGKSLAVTVPNAQTIRAAEAWVTFPAPPPAVDSDGDLGYDRGTVLAVTTAIDVPEGASSAPFLTVSVAPVSGIVTARAGAATTSSGPNICDGHLHHVVVSFTPGGTVELYVDGALAGTNSPVTAALIARDGVLSVGDIAAHTDKMTQDSTISHVAFYDHQLTAARVADHYATGVALEESTGERAERLALFAGVPAAEADVAGDVVVAAQPTSGKTVLDALRDVEATEGGVLFDAPDGALTMHPRDLRYGATVAATFDAALQQIGSDFRPAYDDSALVNDASATGLDGVSARFTDQSSIDDYGPKTSSGSTLAVDDDAALMSAAWLVNTYAQPHPRVPSLTVDVMALITDANLILDLITDTI